jgi:hypothetical protein
VLDDVNVDGKEPRQNLAVYQIVQFSGARKKTGASTL